MKKDFKHLLRGKKQAPDRAGADVAGERVSSSVSLLQPGSGVEASGHNEEGARISADISQLRSKRPSPIPADEGRRDELHRKEAGVDEKEGSKRDLSLDPDVGVAAGSEPNPEGKRAYSPLPVTSVPRDQESACTLTLPLHLLCLITPSRNAGIFAVPDHMQKELHHDETAKSDAPTNEKKSSWKSIAYTTAKLLLQGVRDSADAFGPLKSVAGGLCFILENCEVSFFPTCAITTLTGTPAYERE